MRRVDQRGDRDHTPPPEGERDAEANSSGSHVPEASGDNARTDRQGQPGRPEPLCSRNGYDRRGRMPVVAPVPPPSPRDEPEPEQPEEPKPGPSNASD
ncbi:nucleolar protein 3-like [Sitophilus oryzae]|uniref:Nucleolar protein 3-like n=1 Tax=Sitophilus oryzae TaxID=7048 RepID=A0A6J2Y065_SITOR|nr:nucleolar protein 3-like [Sitophilus oryzae]